MNNNFSTVDDIRGLIENETAVIIYFYSDNCAPCVSLRPKVQQLVNESFPQIKLVLINAEAQPTLPVAFSVFANPTLILFFDGHEYRRESKYISIPQLSESIERPYNMLF